MLHLARKHFAVAVQICGIRARWSWRRETNDKAGGDAPLYQIRYIESRCAIG